MSLHLQINQLYTELEDHVNQHQILNRRLVEEQYRHSATQQKLVNYEILVKDLCQKLDSCTNMMETLQKDLQNINQSNRWSNELGSESKIIDELQIQEQTTTLAFLGSATVDTTEHPLFPSAQRVSSIIKQIDSLELAPQEKTIEVGPQENINELPKLQKYVRRWKQVESNELGIESKIIDDSQNQEQQTILASLDSHSAVRVDDTEKTLSNDEIEEVLRKQIDSLEVGPQERINESPKLQNFDNNMVLPAFFVIPTTGTTFDEQSYAFKVVSLDNNNNAPVLNVKKGDKESEKLLKTLEKYKLAGFGYVKLEVIYYHIETGEILYTDLAELPQFEQGSESAKDDPDELTNSNSIWNRFLKYSIRI